jgi:hypothetical protein
MLLIGKAAATKKVARLEQDAKGVSTGRGSHALRVLLRACHPRTILADPGGADYTLIVKRMFEYLQICGKGQFPNPGRKS